MNPMLDLEEMIVFTNLLEVRQNTVAKFRIAKHRYQKALAQGLPADEINEVMQTFNDLLDTIGEIDKCLPKFMLAGEN